MTSKTRPTAAAIKKAYLKILDTTPDDITPGQLMMAVANADALIDLLGEKFSDADTQALRKTLVETAQWTDTVSQWANPDDAPSKKKAPAISENTSADFDDPDAIRNHQRVKVHVDGASKGNPGPSSAGIVITDLEDNPIYETGVYLGEMTNNAAEYNGLISALEILTEHGAPEAYVFADSQLMVKQVNQEWRVKHPGMKPLFTRVQHLKRRLPRFQITHVRREHNQRADELANLAIKQHRDASII
jgi:ribonuclease HI